MKASLHLLKAKLEKVGRQLPFLPRALGLVWSAARGWTIAWALLLLIQGVLPVLAVYTTRWLVNALVAMVRAGGGMAHARPVLAPLVLMAAILLATEALNGAIGWVRAAQAELVQDHIAELIHAKSTAVDLAFYESPEFYDHLHRARQEASYRPLTLLESVGSLVQNSITLLAMSAVLLPYGWWLPAALAVSTLPALFVVMRSSIRQYRWRVEKTAEERRCWYYDWLLTSGETASELRLFDLGGYFRQAYQALRSRLRAERLDLAREEGLAELGSGVLALVVMGLAMAWMVRQAIIGRVTLGDVALLYQAFQQGLRLMRVVLKSVGQLYANSLFLSNLFAFLALEPEIVDARDPAPAPEGAELRFENVTFSYPGSDRTALSDFSLTVPDGSIVAVVGSNGAGKSTLIKLACRLYDPTEGRVALGGEDLRALAIDTLRRKITVLFQDPVRYNATVAENVRFGDLLAGDCDPQGACRGVARAIDSAGANAVVDRLPKGVDTLLGKRFLDGAELSGGEWQRISLARAFLRRAPVLLLDEPTSAMDSWAEAAWMARFRELAEGRTVLLITHRFTTAMRADTIHVMQDGGIVESGTHEELVARGGLYAESWRSQMRDHAADRIVQPKRSDALDNSQTASGS